MGNPYFNPQFTQLGKQIPEPTVEPDIRNWLEKEAWLNRLKDEQQQNMNQFSALQNRNRNQLQTQRNNQDELRLFNAAHSNDGFQNLDHLEPAHPLNLEPVHDDYEFPMAPTHDDDVNSSIRKDIPQRFTNSTSNHKFPTTQHKNQTQMINSTILTTTPQPTTTTPTTTTKATTTKATTIRTTPMTITTQSTERLMKYSDYVKKLKDWKKQE